MQNLPIDPQTGASKPPTSTELREQYEDLYYSVEREWNKLIDEPVLRTLLHMNPDMNEKFSDFCETLGQLERFMDIME